MESLCCQEFFTFSTIWRLIILLYDCSDFAFCIFPWSFSFNHLISVFSEGKQGNEKDTLLGLVGNEDGATDPREIPAWSRITGACDQHRIPLAVN